MRRIRNISLLLGVLGALIYRSRRRLVAPTLLGLDPARYRVAARCNLRVPMSDGITLATDHYWPVGLERATTVLIRSPYGRGPGSGIFGEALSLFAQCFAERGYHTIVQDTRGRFDSDGDFDPLLYERQDGCATLDWLARQSWFNGVVGLWGPSYLGIVQWAIADSPFVRAIVPSVTASQLYPILYPQGALNMALAIRWLGLFQDMDNHRSLLSAIRMLQRVERAATPAFDTLPLIEADRTLLGQPQDVYRKWLQSPDPDAPVWQQVGHLADFANITAPAHLIGGWYDFFLQGLLADYHTLKASGQQPYLTIGPWSHFSRAFVMLDSLQEGIAWFDAFLNGDRRRLRAKPVRIFVTGEDEWRDLDDWPPSAIQVRYYLGPGFNLTPEIPATDWSADCFHYDPADPTPAVGGAQFSPWGGPHDNRLLEARPDVLVYTAPPLGHPLEIIGAVKLELFVRSSLNYTDFFGRLCDVHPDGRSINICDGLCRLRPGSGERQADGSLRIEIDMWATAHLFQPGHRLRLQVSSGAHPRWTRNLGTGEPIGTGTTMLTADQTVYHDSRRPSALILPVQCSG